MSCYQFILYLFPDCFTCTCSGKTVPHKQLVISLDFIYSMTATHVHAVEKECTYIACYQFRLYFFPDNYTCACSGKTVPQIQLVISLDFIYSLTATHIHAVGKQYHSHSLLLVQTFLFSDCFTCICSGKTVPHTQLVISLYFIYSLTALHVHAVKKQCHTHSLLLVQTLFIA